MTDFRWVNDIIDKGFFTEGEQKHTGLVGATDAITFDGHAVEVTFNGLYSGYFICGCDQEIKVGRKWVKAKDLEGMLIGKATRVTRVVDVGIKTLYDYTIPKTHSYKVHINGLELTAHNLNIGKFLGINNSIAKQTWYMYIPYEATKPVVLHKKQRERKEVTNIDKSELVNLGGTFEKVGDEDEALGGGNQKVGTNNQ